MMTFMLSLVTVVIVVGAGGLFLGGLSVMTPRRRAPAWMNWACLGVGAGMILAAVYLLNVAASVAVSALGR